MTVGMGEPTTVPAASTTSRTENPPPEPRLRISALPGAAEALASIILGAVPREKEAR